tara:strand:- start:2433 stop:2585 length:153 start_codon:yes stop_codon:yes gene_type:complete
MIKKEWSWMLNLPKDDEYESQGGKGKAQRGKSERNENQKKSNLKKAGKKK